MEFNGLITVRTGSTRLKKKCLLNFGKVNIIEHVIIRALKGKIIPVVCTTQNKSDDIIVTIAKKLKVKFFRGSNKNKIKRWHDCAKKFNLKSFHTIDADDPYFDQLAIKNSLKALREINYDIIYPSKISRAGSASEGYSFSIDAIKKLNKIIQNDYKNYNNLDTEMIEKFINNKLFKTKIFNGMDYQLKKTRLTLDYIEDYNMLNLIRKNLGNYISRKKINKFLKINKEIVNLNYFRNLDWEKKQIKQLSSDVKKK